MYIILHDTLLNMSLFAEDELDCGLAFCFCNLSNFASYWLEN